MIPSKVGALRAAASLSPSRSPHARVARNGATFAQQAEEQAVGAKSAEKPREFLSVASGNSVRRSFLSAAAGNSVLGPAFMLGMAPAVRVRSGDAVSTQANAPNDPTRIDRPLYGEAAAIYAMYQGPFLERDQKRPTPRKPRSGLRERLSASLAPFLPAPAYARATP